MALSGAALAAFMHLPLVVHITTDIANSPENIGIFAGLQRRLYLGDPLFSAWEVAWDGHALVRQPLRFFDANAFWPLPNSLAYSDALLGYAPLGVIGSGPKAALIRYNGLFLFSYAMAFVGAYLLGKEISGSTVGGAVAGVAFAFNPWRVAQQAHLHVLSSGGIPLAVWLLWRGWRDQRPWMLFAGWLTAAWQLSVGFTLGVPFVYLMVVLAALGGGAWLIRRHQVRRSAVAAGVAGLLIFGGWALLQARPYLEVIRTFPEVDRRISQATSLSPPAGGYLAAPRRGFVWGTATKPFRDRLAWPEEQTLFPGATVTILALWGLLRSRAPRKVRLSLFAAALVFGVLALGFKFFGGAQGYSVLWNHAPGWRASRTPGRLVTFMILALSLLAALGLTDIVRLLVRRPHQGSDTRRLAVTGFAAMAVLLEAAAPVVHATVPSRPVGLSRARAPRLQLPMSPGLNFLYMYWSTEDFAPIVNGHSTFVPCLANAVARDVRRFPDRRSVRLLRSLGVNSVVLHTDLALGTPWELAGTRSVRGLGVRRQRVGKLVIFALADQPLSRPVHDPTDCRSF